jgi:hypothetical protein
MQDYPFLIGSAKIQAKVVKAKNFCKLFFCSNYLDIQAELVAEV